MNEALKKDEKYRKKYMKNHRMLCLLLDNEKDKDIISWLGDQQNRSEAVRKALRKIANKENDNEQRINKP